MLHSFRVQYPQGSLLSEFLQVEHGLFVVRVEVQVEGMTLGSGLAAGRTIEEAEDLARLRALETLLTETSGESSTSFIPTPTVSAAIAISPPTSPEPLPIQPPVIKPLPVSTKITEPVPDVLPLSIQEIAPEPFPLAPMAPVAELPVTKPQKTTAAAKSSTSSAKTAEPVIAEPVIAEPVIAEPVVDKQPELSKTEILSLLPSEIEKEDPPISSPALPLEQSLDLKGDGADYADYFDETGVAGIPAEVESELEVAVEPESEPESGPEAIITPTHPPKLTLVPSAEPIDFSEVIAKSNMELKRLGWTSDQGRNYLLQTYGKRSRQLLSDEELLEFLQHLEGQPTPIKA